MDLGNSFFLLEGGDCVKARFVRVRCVKLERKGKGWFFNVGKSSSKD